NVLKMKPTLIIVLSLFFLVVCAKVPVIVKQVQVHEVLPSPLIVTRDQKNPNKYRVESAWYGTGYEDE
ncbi:9654_t:CDS:1, partial [Acaulospora colombiana]